MPRIPLLAATIAALAVPLPALAQSSQGDLNAGNAADAARAMVEEWAGVLDANGDRRIDGGEMAEGLSRVFPSVDADSSGSVSQAEFRDWEFGLAEMAAFRDRAQAYDAAMGVVFDLYDRDDDGALTMEEYREAIDRSMAYADFDEDGAMSYDEFRRGFIINVALRHAMVE